jgi:hypothetical protein
MFINAKGRRAADEGKLRLRLRYERSRSPDHPILTLDFTNLAGYSGHSVILIASQRMTDRAR